MANSSNEMIGSKMNTAMQIKDYLQGQALVERYQKLKPEDLTIDLIFVGGETIDLCREIDSLIATPYYNAPRLLEELLRGGGQTKKPILLKSGIEINIRFSPKLGTPRPLRVSRVNHAIDPTPQQAEEVVKLFDILNLLLT